MIMAIQTALPKAQFRGTKPGVQWEYVFSLGQVACRVCSFGSLQEGKREFLLDLNQQRKTVARGRSNSDEQVFHAVVLWLKNYNLPLMYAQFDFIDAETRYLNSVLKIFLAISPELEKVVLNVPKSDWYNQAVLEFKNANRCCAYQFWGYEPPKILFMWDDCVLFKFHTEDFSRLAEAIRLWVLGKAMPSVMNQQFPWFEPTQLSQHYEAGTGVKGEFLESWSRTEEFFSSIKYPEAKNALKFIANLRQKGFDQTLRAGQSLTVLVVSRSRRHGLRSNQTAIFFFFSATGTKLSNPSTNVEMDFDGFEVHSDIERQLRLLEVSSID
jgi:hypothetical protein